MRFGFKRGTPAYVTVFAILAACATSDQSTLDIDASTGDGGLVDSNSDRGTGQDTGTDSGGGCVPSCNTDQDCQSSCPPAPNNGINCCDTGSHVCFASSAGQCQAGQDSGTD
jgi:hypothetical protein